MSIFDRWYAIWNIPETLYRIERRLRTMDARVQHIADEVTALKGAADTAVTKLTELRDQVATLIEQLNNSIPVTQEDLDALDAQIMGVTSELATATA